MERIRQFFLASYSGTGYLMESRSRLLMAFDLVFVVLVLLLQLSMAFVGWEDFLKTLYITPFLIAGFVISLTLLKNGKYFGAANTLIGFASTAVIGGLLREPFMNPEFAYSSYIYFVYPLLIMCVIFTRKRTLTIVSLSFIITNIILLIIMTKIVQYPLDKQVMIAFNNINFSIIFFYIIAMAVTRIFNRSIDLANQESTRNLKSVEFIQEMLDDGTQNLVSGMNEMSEMSRDFADRAQEQASSVEEVTATIEEISAGIENVAGFARNQDQGLEEMTAVLNELSDIIGGLDATINDSQSAMDDITDKAGSGERSLREMEKNMGNIRQSSEQMTGIIGIINDISDQINLLSLNAAIEAARAGDSGRGFAVVADEISKLADRTATSIKDINALIKTNDSEIKTGMSVAGQVVESISIIMDSLERVRNIIDVISDYREKQKETNVTVNSNADRLKQHSQEILSAADEQKNALSEILKSVSYINEISQQHSQGASGMSGLSERQLKMVKNFMKRIEEYRG